MKLTTLARGMLLASVVVVTMVSVHAQPVTSSGYGVTSIYTDPDANSIVSFDWDSSNNLYYQSHDSNFNLAGFYEVTAGVRSAPILSGSSSTFAGASVVNIGGDIYFNDSDFTNQNIYKYDPALGGSATLISTATNYGLYKGAGGSMFITGASFGNPNHIYYSSSSDLASAPPIPSPLDLGSQSPGGSGPLAFDSSGNLYYAPGFSDPSIYKWTAAQVAAALLNPTTNGLTVSNADDWLNYSSIYGAASGGTSLLVENGQLLLTLTDFSDPSDLASFGIDPTTGEYVAGSANTILTDTDLLGELRLNGGNLYVSAGSTIYEVQSVPEPSTWFLLMAGMIGLVCFRSRQTRRLVPAAVASTVFFSR